MRPQLVCDERTQEVARILLKAPAPSALARPLGGVVMQAGIDLLPDWAQRQFGFHPGAAAAAGANGRRRPGKVLGASMRNGSYQRAVRRITQPS